MENRAKLSQYFTVMEYKKPVRYGEFIYKGRKYQVRYGGWNCASDEEPWMQHKREQNRIDELIEMKKQENDKPKQCGDDVWKALDMFFSEFE